MSDLISDTLVDQLIAVFDDPSYRPPPLPEVALELMTMVGREETDVDQVVVLLERDAMLAATVLRLVMSPIYAGRTPIRSLKEAVVRLGVRGVRDAVFEVSLRSGVFTLPEYSDTMGAVARHSTVTAYLTRVVCRRAGIDSDTAFICGLLHDIGYAGLLLAVSQIEADSAPPLRALWGDLDRLHERASNLLCDRWGMPSTVSIVAGQHHHLDKGPLAPVAAAVRLADYLTERFGAIVLGPLAQGEPMPGDRLVPFDLNVTLQQLGIDDTEFAAIVIEAERVVPEIAGI